MAWIPAFAGMTGKLGAYREAPSLKLSLTPPARPPPQVVFVGMFDGHVDDVADLHVGFSVDFRGGGLGVIKNINTDHTDFITDRTDKFIISFSMSHGESVAAESE